MNRIACLIALGLVTACWSSTPAAPTTTRPTPSTSTASTPEIESTLSFYDAHGLFVALAPSELSRFGHFHDARARQFELANGELAAFTIDGDTLSLETYEFITLDANGRAVGAGSGSELRVEGITNATSRRAALTVIGLILTGVDVTNAIDDTSGQYRMKTPLPSWLQGTRRINP